MSKKIPIVLLTKDEPRCLYLTVKAIFNRTNYPFSLYIVDNKSTSVEQASMLIRVAREFDVQIIFNENNEWLLGFNKAVNIIKDNQLLDANYIVLSDGDIIVPVQKQSVCWLEYLKYKMDNNISIGKIGLALDLSLIKVHSKFSNTYDIEKRYMKGPKIDDLIVAPVDTTMAIYRKDLYILKNFKIIPGHASLVKPCYYVFRTSETYQAKHLGWSTYSKPTNQQVEEKVSVFTKYAAYVDPMVLGKVSRKNKYFYIYFRYFYKVFWGAQVLYFWVKYIIIHFPRNLNEIQSKYR